MAGDESDPRQFAAAVHVVVDHVSDRVVERVMELLQLRLAAQERSAPVPHERNKREDGTGRTPDLPNFMTLGEAAKYLNRPLETVAHWVHRCRLIDKYKIGVGRGRVMVKRADLDAMLQKVERRGSLRDQARELLKASDRRAEDLKRRRIDHEPRTDELPLAAASRRLRRLASAQADGIQPKPGRATAKLLKLPTSSPTPAGGSA